MGWRAPLLFFIKKKHFFRSRKPLNPIYVGEWILLIKTRIYNREKSNPSLLVRPCYLVPRTNSARGPFTNFMKWSHGRTTGFSLVAVSWFLTTKDGSLTAKILPWVATGKGLTTQFCQQTAICREPSLMPTSHMYRVSYLAHGKLILNK
jgi:hypothetical protein